MRIVFFGTPDFAVPSLRALLGTGHEILAVITQPLEQHAIGDSREIVNAGIAHERLIGNRASRILFS